MIEENAAGVSSDPRAFLRRAVWGMLYADDAGIVSKSAEGLAKIMTVIVTVLEAAGLTVSEKKTETMLLLTPDQAPCTSPLVIEAAGQRYRQTRQFLYLGGLVDASAVIIQRSNGGSDSHGHATVDSSGSCTIWRMPCSL